MDICTSILTGYLTLNNSYVLLLNHTQKENPPSHKYLYIDEIHDVLKFSKGLGLM